MLMINKKIITIIAILIGGLLSGTITGSYIAFTRDLPQIRSLESFVPYSTTRIYSSDDILLAELFVEKRVPVRFDKIPVFLKSAIVSTEDKHFYNHSGIDVKGILRAILKNVLARKYAEGASTITQQLAKTLFLTHKKTITRKIKGAFLAVQLERRYTKDEILGLYLNQVYFGSGAYGIDSAAKTFFGKNVFALSLGECALIAGMPKSPSRYSPLVNMNLAIMRKKIVLKQMLKNGLVSETEYRGAIEEPVNISGTKKNIIRAPYFVDYIKRTLEKDIGPSLLYKGGLVVYTTLSFKMQENC